MLDSLTPDRSLTAKKFLPGIAWFFVVMLLLFTPGNDLPELGSWFSQLNFDKLIHIGVFGLMAYLFMLPIGKSPLPGPTKAAYFLKIFIACCIWGITSELIQKYFIPGRSFSLLDWIADSIGGFLAQLICRKRYLN
ncbi:MAG: VanZ family protein [Ferruginibacter sp.]